MLLPALAVVIGLIVLVWSADRFIDGAAAVARHLGLPSLVIGMVVVGFGTSAPEMVVSAIAALDGNPTLALGNALGSNIANTGLIVGITALIAPIAVHAGIVRRELPVLLGVTLFAGLLLADGELTRIEAWTLLGGFAGMLVWTARLGMAGRPDPLAGNIDQEVPAAAMGAGKAVFWCLSGMLLLVLSSRILVWGAVAIAQSLGISDLIIGLTIVALGTSLPELAASILAARKGEHDIALGNIVGSNLFNLLAVIGIAGAIMPMTGLPAEVLSRDWPTMLALTVALLVMGYGFRGPGRINRLEGALLLLAFTSYNIWLLFSVLDTVR